MTDDASRVLIVEDKYDGHYLYYVRLLALEALDRGAEVVLLTAPGLRDVDEGEFYLHDLQDRIRIVEAGDRSIGTVEALAFEMHASQTVIPDADLWLRPIVLRGGWHGPGDLELLVLRSSTQPRPVPGVQTARTVVKWALLAVTAALPNVHLSVLRSSLWRGRSLLRVTRDPITLSADAAAVDAFASREGIDDERTWFAVLGNITSRKNLPLVAEAVARVATSAQVGLLIAGKVEAGELARAAPALDRIRATGAVQIVDRMLDEEELDAAVALADCLVLAHSNEGPSGLLAKAAATGTRVVTAGARTLRADSRRVPTIAAWAPLDADRIADLLVRVPTLPRPRPAIAAGTAAFTGGLLGTSSSAASWLRVMWCAPSFGPPQDLAYFEPIFRGLAARFPRMTIPVPVAYPVDRYPDLPLRTILRFHGTYGAYGNPGRLIPSVGTVLRLVRLRPQVLVCIEFTPISVLAMVLARLVPGRRRVLLLLESDPAYRGSAGSHRVNRVKSLLTRFADVVVANSRLAQRFGLERLGLPSAKVVVANYLTSEPLRERPVRTARPNGPKSVLFANSLVPRKGADHLLRAFAALPDSARTAARLDVVGDGEDRPDLDRMARELGIREQVVFHGHVPYRELPAYYGRADLVVAPSLADYRSLGAIEAASSGLPSIVSIHDGAHAELARSGAYVVDPKDTRGFTAALAALLMDEAEYAARATTAHSHRREHSVDRVVDNLTALFLDRPLP